MRRDESAMPAPEWSSAFVPSSKADFYLGQLDDPKSRGRAAAFVDYLGFEHPQQVVDALVRHAQTNHPILQRVTAWGAVYRVVGPLQGPSGRRFDRMLTVWMVHRGRTTPFNITALPTRKPTE
jgi:hypothetical protein